MRVIAVKMLSDFYRQDAYRDCAGPAKAWYALATVAQWARPADVVAEVPKASILKDGRNGALMAAIGDLRKGKAVKLPDAIVVASAALHRATLLTNDTQLLKLAADEPGYPAVPF